MYISKISLLKATVGDTAERRVLLAGDKKASSVSRRCSDPPPNCGSTNRPVGYSAGLYDLQYRLYIGQAH